MLFVVGIPFWLGILVWVFSSGSRRRARQHAVHMVELQTVAAMTEAMKEEYWARKHAEKLALAAPQPFRSGLAFLLLVMCALVLLAGVYH